MACCYIIKRTECDNKFKVNRYTLSIPEVDVEEYLFPKGLIWNFIQQCYIKKLSKKSVVIHKKYTHDKKILERNLINTLEYVLNSYGWEKSETEIALVINRVDKTTVSIVSQLSNFARFLVVYGTESSRCEDLFTKAGICVRYCDLSEPLEKIAVYIEDTIELSILGKKYNDVTLFFNIENCCLNMIEFEHICREFANTNDYKKLFENNYVKKMALRSK